MPISRPVSPSPPALFASVAVFVLGAGLAHAETADDARLRQLAGQAASYAGEVRSLLAKGADPAVPDRGGRTAVHAAARIGAIETVAALLDAGGDPNKRDEDGNTPLHLAANASQPTLVNQSIATIRVLLAEGADPCIRNARGLFPYSVAAEGGRLRQVLNRAGACEKHEAVSLDLSQRRQIQEALTSARFDSGPADGKFGPRTRRAIQAWQQANGHAATGELTRVQVEAMLSSAQGEPQAPTVREAQRLLSALGYKPGPADGLWGPRTASAYAAFLRDAGLSQEMTLGEDAMRTMRKIAGTRKAPGSVGNAGKEAVSGGRPSMTKAAGSTRVATATRATTGPTSKCDGWNTPRWFRGATPERAGECLQAGVDPNARSKFGNNTALHLAVRYNKNPAVAVTLLEAGADLEARDAVGNTTLAIAARDNANPMVAATLLKAGAKANARNDNGSTPLHLAAQFNKTPDVAAALLDAGADPNARDEDGRTPLALANAYLRNPAVAALLKGVTKCDWNTRRWFQRATPEKVAGCLRNGGDLTLRDKDGSTPLHFAARFNRNPAVAVALIDAGADLTARDDDGHTPLHGAAWLNENPAVVTTLLEAGADPDARTEKGNTPAALALQKNAPAVFAALLKGGADLDARDKYGETRLHRAAGNANRSSEDANLSEVAALIQAGADLGARDSRGATALHKAASINKNPAVIAVLIKGGADPNVRDRGEFTPLHLAATGKNPAVVSALIQGGADPNARRGKSEERPLHAALWHDNPAVWRALIKGGADMNARDQYGQTPLHKAAYFNKPAFIAALLQAGANPNPPDIYGETPLHNASEIEDPASVVAALIKGGADPNAGDRYGETPLHDAVHDGNPAAVEALIRGGADPNKQDNAGSSSLHAAASKSEEPAVISALIKGGADPNLQNKRGDTPMDYAQEENNAAVIAAFPNSARRKSTGGQTARSGSGATGCADGPICLQSVKNAQVVLDRVGELVATKNLDITNNSLALAFTTRASIACMKACLEREETRADCRSGLQQAVSELERTYQSAIRSARQASLDDNYVDQFESSPQNSPFGRKYFSHIQGNLDTCGY